MYSGYCLTVALSGRRRRWPRSPAVCGSWPPPAHATSSPLWPCPDRSQTCTRPAWCLAKRDAPQAQAMSNVSLNYDDIKQVGNLWSLHVKLSGIQSVCRALAQHIHHSTLTADEYLIFLHGCWLFKNSSYLSTPRTGSEHALESGQQRL